MMVTGTLAARGRLATNACHRRIESTAVWPISTMPNGRRPRSVEVVATSGFRAAAHSASVPSSVAIEKSKDL